MIKLICFLCAIIAFFVIISIAHPTGRKITLYAVLIVVALIMLLPFYLMFVMSTLSTNQIYSFPPILVFDSNLITNFKNMVEAVNLPRAFLNSCIVTFSYVFLVLFFCSIGGYAFSVYEFPGKNALFSILLVTMMIPATAGIIPWFIMMSKFGWLNDYKALIIPGCANAFGIFWMRQYCQNNVPKELMEAARIDGCSEWLIFFRVIAPILKPAYASLGIMQFVNQWNEFTQALMILRKEKYYTLPLLLKTMVSDRGTDYGAMMLASTCAVLPLLICFLCASKFFMDGLTAGAVKQ
ncbi:MAG: carbohydrate ABC transporter permease [Clostridiales bacterium]|nr:carbohydrate ABC transporter permease [Clostridiales bacterium]